MIHIGGLHPRQVRQILSGRSRCAFPAKGFSQELHWSQFVNPDRQAVPLMPSSCIPAAPLLILGAVFLTVSAAYQFSASGMGTRPEGFRSRSITSKAKQKTCTTIASLRFMAQALRRRLRRDIHDAFPAASFALDRQVLDLCGWQQKQHRMLFACRTKEASLICLNFTTTLIVLQYFSTSIF